MAISPFFFFNSIEYVTITPDGFRYRSQIFPTVNGLFRWFKDHYQEPVPGMKTVYSCVKVYPAADETYIQSFSYIFSSVKGITPSNSSRTRTPASLNATPANINIAGQSCFHKHKSTFFISRAVFFIYHLLTCYFLPRLDASCQCSPTQHDLSDVQCHRCSHRPGPEPKHHPRTVGIQSVRLRWQHGRRRRELLCLSCESRSRKEVVGNLEFLFGVLEMLVALKRPTHHLV